LLELHSSPELANQLTGRAFETYSERYTLGRSVDAWETAMLAVLANPARGNKRFCNQHNSGRLSRLLGTKLAESVRRWCGRQPHDAGPGGEWPHTLSGAEYDDDRFWTLARQLDRPTYESNRVSLAPRAPSRC
jgi:hypothetical protein